jgi:TPR repeat protein
MSHDFKVIALTLALSCSAFAQSDFEALKARAEAGDADAQFELGGMYRDGSGVSIDDGEAQRWYSLAAEQGDVSAQLALAEMYDIGLVFEESDRNAVRWYRAAALQGNSRAQYMLGIKYETGSGTPQNYVRAYLWFAVSAAQGEEFALEARDKVRAELSPQALEQAQAQATRCFESNFKDCD